MTGRNFLLAFAAAFCASQQAFSAIPSALVETNAELRLRGAVWRMGQDQTELRNQTRGQSLADRYRAWSEGRRQAEDALQALALEGGKQWGQEAQSWADRTPGVRTPASILVGASTFYTGREIRYRLTDHSRVGFRTKIMNRSGSVFFQDRDFWGGLLWQQDRAEPLVLAVRQPLALGFSGSVEFARGSGAQAVLSRPVVDGVQASLETRFSGEEIFRINYGLGL